MLALAYKEFLGNSPLWFKNVILLFLVVCWPLQLIAGTTVLGWMFIAMFILTLAMALKCYPLQSGGLIAIAILALGLTTPETVLARDSAEPTCFGAADFYGEFYLFYEALVEFCLCEDHRRCT